MLMLLTFCDSMGNPKTDLWTGFKDSLIWTLYDRTRQSLQGVLKPKPALDEAKKTLYPQLREKVRKAFRMTKFKRTSSICRIAIFVIGPWIKWWKTFI